MAGNTGLIGMLHKRQKQLFICLLLALWMHVFLVYAVKFAPSQQVLQTPISVLKIKLGNGPNAKSDKVWKPEPRARKQKVKPAEKTVIKETKKTVEKAKSVPPPVPDRLAKYTAKKVETPKATKPPIKVKKVQKKAVPDPKVKTALRPNTSKTLEKPKPVKGDILGNKNTQQEHQLHATRYTQKISLWINKFKHYPKEVQNAGIEGKVGIYLVIDRKGNIRNHLITRHSPYPILDKLAMDAVRRANPVPALPSDYPQQGEQVAFIISLNFRLD